MCFICKRVWDGRFKVVGLFTKDLVHVRTYESVHSQGPFHLRSRDVDEIPFSMDA